MFVSVILPCLNESRTVGSCVYEALAGLRAAGVQGEVIVVDNGSTDGSAAKAQSAGARIVHSPERGYGAALISGFAAARGDILIMADADGTYCLAHIPRLLRALKNGADVVIGNRRAGGIEQGATRWLHRYVGVPALTWLVNRLFGVRIGDCQCGLRAFTREAYERIQPQRHGMEFASELIVRAAQLRMKIREVPTVLRRGPQGRVPHLRSLRDGLRNLRFLAAARLGRRRSGAFRTT